jgi:hypothetical protein
MPQFLTEILFFRTVRIAWKLNQQTAVSNMSGSEADRRTYACQPMNLPTYLTITKHKDKDKLNSFLPMVPPVKLRVVGLHGDFTNNV